jgi:hypothetical protein
MSEVTWGMEVVGYSKTQKVPKLQEITIKHLL